MQINKFYIGNQEIVEVVSDETLINSEQDILDLVVSIDSHYIVLQEHNISKDFFDLSTRLAGDVLQKCVNYHIHLAIIGSFDKYPGKSLKAFIYENNRCKDFLFVPSLEDVRQKWEKFGK